VIVAGTALVQRDGVDLHLLGPGEWFGGDGAMTPGGAASEATIVAFSDLVVRVYDPREVAALQDAVPMFDALLARSVPGTALELVAVHDRDGGSDVVDPAQGAQGPQALHDSLA
jgi:hypothetical protein